MLRVIGLNRSAVDGGSLRRPARGRHSPQRTYVETVARFARYFGRSPTRLGLEQIRAYQVYLTTERGLAPSSLVVAVSALRFLYRVTLQKRWSFDDAIPVPKKPRSLPVVQPRRGDAVSRRGEGRQTSRHPGHVLRRRRAHRRSRFISSRRAPTCAPFSSCSGIGACRPRRGTCRSRPPRSAQPRVRWICSHGPYQNAPRTSAERQPCHVPRSPWRRCSAATAIPSGPRSEPPSRRRTAA